MDKIPYQTEMLIAEVELIYKRTVMPSKIPGVNSSTDSFNIFYNSWDMNKIELYEEFKVLLLNRANKVLGIFNVSSGGITGTVADPRLILMAAIKSVSSGLILCHNHPSGCLRPSRADEQLTQKIKQACMYVDISVLDHLIISKEGFYSFADEGIL